MNKNILIFTAIFIISAAALMIANFAVFEAADNFWINNASFCVTAVLAAAGFLTVKNYSKAIAFAGVLLFFFIYEIFARAISLGSVTFTRMAIILTQIAIMIFAVVCAKIAQKKTTDKIKQEVAKYVSEQIYVPSLYCAHVSRT